MNPQFATAMRRASQQMRAQNLAEATRLIQNALNHRPELVRTEADGGAKNRIRRPLGETLAALKQTRFDPNLFGGLPRQASPGRQGDGAVSIPQGARFETREFSCAAGARSYKLYVPASATVQPKGLLVMLHGCTQNPNDFAIGTGMNAIAEMHGFAVAYPAQTKSNNASACWNWFSPQNQRRDAGEPSIIAGLTRELIAEFDLDRTRVFVAGLSAGGAMAAVMADAYPELYAGVGVHSGLPTGAAHDVASAFAAMRGAAGGSAKTSRTRVRTIIFQGMADTTVHASNAQRIMTAATPDAASIYDETTAGREARRGYTRTVVADPAGEIAVELWLIEGAGHAWSGGRPGGSYVDPTGPDASAEMMRFFLGHTRS